LALWDQRSENARPTSSADIAEIATSHASGERIPLNPEEEAGNLGSPGALARSGPYSLLPWRRASQKIRCAISESKLGLLAWELYCAFRPVVEPEHGQDLVEYAMIVALFALAAIAGVQSVGQQFNQILTQLAAFILRSFT
jgi:Flp pilus assembly pilin Flp